jgi:hypothetical protein
MKRILLAAVLVHFAVSSAFAEERPTSIRMTTSGTMTATNINFGKNTVTDDEQLAGYGTLGAFTFHGLRADGSTPQLPEPPITCATPLFLPLTAGGGVFRFEDGSLLVVNITGGGICIDLNAGVGVLTETYEVARGTGRFNHASGALTLTVTVIPVLFNADGAPQMLTMTGKFEGAVSGISHDGRR